MNKICLVCDAQFDKGILKGVTCSSKCAKRYRLISEHIHNQYRYTNRVIVNMGKKMKEISERIERLELKS